MKDLNNVPPRAHPADVHFDGTKLMQLPADLDHPEPIQWFPLEVGSDEHIAFLEQAIKDLQATVEELKAEHDAKEPAR